jgi:uncharacterized lipoprotein YmbA
MKVWPLIIAAALMLPACASSPPTHFFTLTPAASVGRSSAAPAFPVQVAAVHIPAILDRQAMVRQTGPNALSISDQNRWGAPLGEMARNVLTQDLTERLPQGAVILPDAPATASAARLVVDIASFTEEAGGRVRLQGSWALMRGQPPKTILNRDMNLECKAGGDDPAAQAAAMSRLVGQLADSIVADLAATSLRAEEAPQ